MPISTNSPIREVLWNRLYAPQYQTIDQNNINVANERSDMVNTGDTMLQFRKQQLEEQLASNPNDPQAEAKMQELRNLDKGLTSSFEQTQQAGGHQQAAYNAGIMTNREMLGLPNLSKKEQLEVTVERPDRDLINNLKEKGKGRPTISAGGPTVMPRTQPAPDMKEYDSYKNFMSPKKEKK